MLFSGKNSSFLQQVFYLQAKLTILNSLSNIVLGRLRFPRRMWWRSKTLQVYVLHDIILAVAVQMLIHKPEKSAVKVYF